MIDLFNSSVLAFAQRFVGSKVKLKNKDKLSPKLTVNAKYITNMKFSQHVYFPSLRRAHLSTLKCHSCKNFVFGITLTRRFCVTHILFPWPCFFNLSSSLVNRLSKVQSCVIVQKLAKTKWLEHNVETYCSGHFN